MATPHVLVEAELGVGVTRLRCRISRFHTRVCRPVGLTRTIAGRFAPTRSTHRPRLRPEEHHRPDALPDADAGSAALAPPRARARLGRPDAHHLLGADRAGVRIRALSDPAARRHSTESRVARRELLEIRHHSLYAPRDFDISPYFSVVKPTIENGFEYKRLHWADLPLPPSRRAAAVDEGVVTLVPQLARRRRREAKPAEQAAGPWWRA